MTALNPTWPEPNDVFVREVEALRDAALEVYRSDPHLLQEHVNQEDSYRTGGYSERQLLELVQNSADAILRAPAGGGRIELRVSGGNLYCANEGQPFTLEGLRAVTHAFISNKRGDEIGRFGLGFKSVLSVSDRVQVFSKSISFEFNSESSRQMIAEVSPPKSPIPILRVPSAASFESYANNDPVLREMSTWASTIVRLPNVSHVSRLKAQLRTFRTEFLLFAPLVTGLRLVVDDSSEPLDLEHRREQVGENRVNITNPNGEKTEWLVADAMHKPTARARAEVGEAVARDEIKLTYAGRLDGPAGVGQFWAHFPLRDETTASGLFNAPWRVNDDRTSLLDGRYNEEIFERFAQLFVEVLPQLRTARDPARHFDYMPARGREARSDGDRFLSTRVPEIAASVGMIPDAGGALRAASTLRWLSPSCVLEKTMMAGWQSAKSAPIDFPHPFCYSSIERRARLNSLLENDPNAGTEQRSALHFAEWLSLLASEREPESMAIAIKLLNAQRDRDLRASGSEARIVPGSDGQLYKANSNLELFLGGELVSDVPGISLVEPSFVEMEGVAEALTHLGFRPVTTELELETLLSRADDGWSGEQWESLWDVFDYIPRDQAISLLRAHTRAGEPLRVLCEDGIWRSSNSVVLPSAGVFDPHEASVRLDVKHHGSDARFLRSAGVVCGVDVHFPVKEEPLFIDYLAQATALYEKTLKRDMTASIGESAFVEEYGPGPISLLKALSENKDFEAQEQWSTLLLRAEGDRSWRLVKRGDSRTAPQEFLAPHLWAISEFGLLATSWGPLNPKLVLSPILHKFADYLPVARDAQASRLEIVDELDLVPRAVWAQFLSRAPRGLDASMLGTLTIRALQSVGLSLNVDVMPAISNDSPTSAAVDTVVVASTSEEITFLRARGTPFIVVAEEELVEYVVNRVGCSKASDQVTFSEITEGMGDSVLAVDRYRGVRKLPGNPLGEVQLVECERIAKRLSADDGVEDSPVDFLRRGAIVYYQRGLVDEELLAVLDSEFRLGLSGMERLRLLEESVESDKKILMEKCRAEDDDALRLLLLFSAAELEGKLPAGLMKTIRAMGVPSKPVDIAELFLNVYGFGALQELKYELQDKGFPAPDRWAGLGEAISFVRQIGFNTAYAGERGRSLESSLLVPGRPGLHALHPYQEELAEQIRSVLRSPEGDAAKAMLYLPTGAGKTRVTVEAAVRSFLSDEINGPLLWIAQSEELCEQAVQTWAEVWSDFADTRSLNIGRLWGANKVTDAASDLTVVVATDAKLRLLVDDYEYDWLKDAAAVIVDEAHVAGDSTMYTRIFRWLGVDGRNSKRPLLGLTATPFKGLSEERTKSLVARFGRNRLDAFPDKDPYSALQEMGVLARVRHEELSGSEFELNNAESEIANGSFSRLAPSVLERIGSDTERTSRLVDHIASLDRDWPVLVFTSSVLSAQILAALLRARGVVAASVSGQTRTHERRRIISEFKAGRIQVLTNCDVLTQGFDAPGVKALYLARPTFSPNAYIQMVGRGLRGPLNGGQEECLIVDVVDTFSNFHGELAFRQFDYLWDAKK